MTKKFRRRIFLGVVAGGCVAAGTRLFSRTPAERALRPGASDTQLATTHNRVDVRADWAGQRGGTATASLSYFMTHNPKQTQWRKLPCSIAGKNRAEVMQKAERLAARLSGLDIHQLAPELREIRQQDQAVRRFVA